MGSVTVLSSRIQKKIKLRKKVGLRLSSCCKHVNITAVKSSKVRSSIFAFSLVFYYLEIIMKFWCDSLYGRPLFDYRVDRI